MNTATRLDGSVAEACASGMQRTTDIKAFAISATSYALLVAILWGATGLFSGMGYETGFPYNSMITSWWRGFLYRADFLRIHTNTFYHLSYLLGKLFGFDGSYVPFQLVYAALWWARGVLVFLILRRLFRGSHLVSHLAGALVLVHASDSAIQWVGQMNQFGFIFWMLLGFYLLTVAYQSVEIALTVAFTFAACFCEQMCIFSYESPLFILLAFPLALFVIDGKTRLRVLLSISAAWYVTPAVYIYLTASKYLSSGGSTYQASVMRKDLSLGSLLGDWGFNIAASLEFWKWPQPGFAPPIFLLILAVLIFLLGGFSILLLVRGREHQGPQRRPSSFGRMFIIGFLAVALSFPAYLLLDSSRGLWRTQMLSGPGAALAFSAVLAWISSLVSRQFARATIMLLGGAVIVYCGTLRIQELGSFHRQIWERHRKALTEVLNLVPSVKPNTIIVLTNIPKENDPFGHDMWFDMALRLAYPGIPAAGLYYYADGTRAPGDTLTAAGVSWTWDGITGDPPLVKKASFANTVVIRFDASGHGRLDSSPPPYICAQTCAAELYNPWGRITGPIAASAVRRYRLGAP